jgi:hypothetical protein
MDINTFTVNDRTDKSYYCIKADTYRLELVFN